MMKKSSFTFTIFVGFIGVLLALQYNALVSPEQRDTRDVWEVREEIAKEHEIQSSVLKDLQQLDEQLLSYERLKDDDPQIALQRTIEQLEQKVGVRPFEGPGLVVRIEPSEESVAMGIPIQQVSPDLLARFVNDVSRLEYVAMQIDRARVTVQSAIRDINGLTTVGSIPLRTPPFELKMGTETLEDSERLYNFLQSSPLRDDFYLDDFVLTIEEPVEQIRLEGSETALKVSHLEEGEDVP